MTDAERVALVTDDDVSRVLRLLRHYHWLTTWPEDAEPNIHTLLVALEGRGLVRRAASRHPDRVVWELDDGDGADV